MKNIQFNFVALVLCFSFLSHASADSQELTPEQKGIAKEVGLILPGMMKEEVRETFGLLEPKVWHTPEGQEVWFYKVPGEQNIYFKGDEVERVEYISESVRPQPDVGAKEI